jgi:DNA-directed RNA polymerase
MNHMRNEVKNDILSHNSKYWIYSNILNIALLLKDQTIYFPTFLDFRGRVYPTPNYLSYQGNDLARSLLLFKQDPNSNSTNIYKEVLDSILSTDNLYSINNQMKEQKMSETKLADIDYLKLYIANILGKNKLSRKGRIK